MASRRLANFYQAHSDFRKAQGHFLRGNKFFTKFLDVFDNISMNFQPLSSSLKRKESSPNQFNCRSEEGRRNVLNKAI